MSRVLVVEDDPSIRSNLERLLRMEDFEVMTAGHGGEAMAILADCSPDIVLSDVTMPVMDGHALLAAMRADPELAQIPVILVTALADRASQRQGMNIGADDYLTKPFQRDELLAALRGRLERVSGMRHERERLAAEAQRLRLVDAVTELPNRVSLLERLPQALAAMQRAERGLALIVLGLDGFARINDSLGHSMGDQFLRAVADRLQLEVDRLPGGSPFNSVARLGSDLFALTLAEIGGGEQVDDFIVRLLASVAYPITIQSHEVFLGASAGVAICPDDAVYSHVLLERAETALNDAKKSGGGRFSYFAPGMNAAATERLFLDNQLHHVLDRGELEIYYQPQLSVSSGRLIGFEALLRWKHPELGWVSPDRFIPVAEQNNLIVPIGAWVLDAACRQAKAWQDEGFGGLRMAVNLSAAQFADDDLCSEVNRVLETTGLPAACLELEITEGTAMQGAERTIAIMHRLKALGVRLALDDFGTGYSSLSYLKRFPLDVLKVDQSFVRNITTDPGDAAITRAVVLLARSFSMSVIAEGVETQAHLKFISELGCDEYQGFLFSRPVPAVEAQRMLVRDQEGVNHG
jgi:diguanylate cyclase (GGDEF)-like protein